MINEKYMKMIEPYEVSKEDEQRLLKYSGINKSIMYAKKYDGFTRLFHRRCGQFIDLKDISQVRHSKLCPICFEQYSKLSYHIEPFYNWLYINPRGFYVYGKLDMDNQKINGHTDYVLFRTGNKTFKRNVSCNTSGYAYYTMDKRFDNWRETESTRLLWNFYDITSIKEPRTKKEAMEEYMLDNIKSNQKKLIIDNLVNINQTKAIVLFDLKNINDVYKYRTWIEQNAWAIGQYYFRFKTQDTTCIEYTRVPNFNVYYLDYFYRNNIKLDDYMDYVSQCKELGYELDKPKDFQTRHDQYSKELVNRKNEIDNKMIQEISKGYGKYSYTDKGKTIKAFESYDELLKCATDLHNCMASSYTKSYAKGECILLHLFDKEQELCGIELFENKIVQFRAKWNTTPTTEDEEIVRRWAKEKGLVLVC